MTVTFIGDVHGWLDRLERLLAQAEGRVVFVGDLVDRGPDAPGVLDLVHRLCDEGRASCLMGNHEYTLLRGLGSADLGFAPDPDTFEIWRARFGGRAVCQAYGAADAADLAEALGRHRRWLERLPWVLDGGEHGSGWIAVHAGLAIDQPTLTQVAQLRQGWFREEDNVGALFDKTRAVHTPADLPDATCVVSGHTPVAKALVTATRILCDTSGGLPNRPLSGVIWPEGRVITS